MREEDSIDIFSNIPDKDANDADDFPEIRSTIRSTSERTRAYYEDISSHDFKSARNKRKAPKEYQDISSNSDKKRKKRKKLSNLLFAGKKTDSKKQKLPSWRRALSIAWKAVASIFLVGVITGSIVVTALTVYVMKFVDKETDIDLTQLKHGYNTTIFADGEEGEPVAVHTLSNGKRYEWVDMDNIPYHVRDAFMYTEDQRFMEHDGVDWKRTFGAFVNMFIDIYGFKQGGSTITQQLIKNITDERDTTIERKVQEIYRAMNLERHYTKNEILEAYLNIVYLGNNVYGVQAAARFYYDKDIEDMTVLEASALAAMTRNPARYDPIAHPDENKDRREYVLKMLRKYNTIDNDEDYEKLLDTDLKTRQNSGGASSSTDGVQSYFVDNVITEVVNDLMDAKGWNRQTAETNLYNNGYRIYTTMDIDAQKILEKKYAKNSTFADYTISDPPESAMIIMDHHGAVKAVVGGRGKKKASRILNRATQSMRSPGSSIKPIAAYAPAIENDLITYSTMMEDEAIETIIGGEKRKWPQNYTKKNYGMVTMEKAIRMSLNTIPVKLIEEMGATKSFNFITQKLGITTLIKSKKVDGQRLTDATLGGLAMGDFTFYGTKLSELTAAYQIFANGGTYTRPHSYTKVTTAAGEVLLSNEDIESKRAISKETAGVMNQLLQQVVKASDGTGRAAWLDGITVAGKTGTSNEYTDQLFIGVTPYYIAGVWYGYDTNEKTVEGLGMSPAKIWKNVMQDVLKNRKDKDFKVPSGVKKLSYCTKTGLLAGDNCPTATGYYKSDNIPATCDDSHKSAKKSDSKKTEKKKNNSKKQNARQDDE